MTPPADTTDTAEVQRLFLFCHPLFLSDRARQPPKSMLSLVPRTRRPLVSRQSHCSSDSCLCSHLWCLHQLSLCYPSGEIVFARATGTRWGMDENFGFLDKIPAISPFKGGKQIKISGACAASKISHLDYSSKQQDHGKHPAPISVTPITLSDPDQNAFSQDLSGEPALSREQ